MDCRILQPSASSSQIQVVMRQLHPLNTGALLPGDFHPYTPGFAGPAFCRVRHGDSVTKPDYYYYYYFATPHQNSGSALVAVHNDMKYSIIIGTIFAIEVIVQLCTKLVQLCQINIHIQREII